MNHALGYAAIVIFLSVLHLTWMLTAVWLLVPVMRRTISGIDQTSSYRLDVAGLALLTLAIPPAIGMSFHQAKLFDLRMNANVQVSAGIESRAGAGELRAIPRATNRAVPVATAARGQTPGMMAAEPGSDRYWNGSQVIGGAVVDSASDRFSAAVPATAQRPQPSVLVWLNRLAPGFAVMYLLGFAIMLSRFGKSVVAVWTVLGDAVPIDDVAVAEVLRRAAQRLGLRMIPAIVESAKIAVPVVVGIWRPTILIPASLLTGMTPVQWETILLHELTHLRRHDQLVVLWQRVLEVVLFFHAAMWSISRRLEMDRELCCDDSVLAAGAMPLQYAEALCRVAELTQAQKRNVLELAATGSVSNQLLIRVRPRPHTTSCERMADQGR